MFESLSLSVVDRDDLTVAVLLGDLDTASTAVLESATPILCASTTPVVLDLHGIRGIDDVGIAALESLVVQAATACVRLTVAVPPGAVAVELGKRALLRRVVAVDTYVD